MRVRRWLYLRTASTANAARCVRLSPTLNVTPPPPPPPRGSLSIKAAFNYIDFSLNSPKLIGRPHTSDRGAAASRPALLALPTPNWRPQVNLAPVPAKLVLVLQWSCAREFQPGEPPTRAPMTRARADDWRRPRIKRVKFALNWHPLFAVSALLLARPSARALAITVGPRHLRPQNGYNCGRAISTGRRADDGVFPFGTRRAPRWAAAAAAR